MLDNVCSTTISHQIILDTLECPNRPLAFRYRIKPMSSKPGLKIKLNSKKWPEMTSWVMTHDWWRHQSVSSIKKTRNRKVRFVFWNHDVKGATLPILTRQICHKQIVGTGPNRNIWTLLILKIRPQELPTESLPSDSDLDYPSDNHQIPEFYAL